MNGVDGMRRTNGEAPAPAGASHSSGLAPITYVRDVSIRNSRPQRRGHALWTTLEYSCASLRTSWYPMVERRGQHSVPGARDLTETYWSEIHHQVELTFAWQLLRP